MAVGITNNSAVANSGSNVAFEQDTALALSGSTIHTNWKVAGSVVAALTPAGSYSAAKMVATNTLSYKRIKVTKTFTNFSAAALTNDIEIFLLPATASIVDVFANVTTAFSGGAIATYTISVGIAGTVLKYMIANSVASTGGLVAAGTKGVGLTTIGLTNIESFTTTKSIRAYATSTVANLNAATQGSMDFYIVYNDAE